MNQISQLFLLQLLYAYAHEMDEASYHLSEMVAEDMNECALYGDGPCGSMSRRHKLSDINGELKLAQSWIRDITGPPEPVNTPVEDDPIPF